MIKIIVSLKEKILHEIILHEDSVTSIGRDPSNNIHLVNPAVSRFHAKISSQGPDFYIEDLGSSNGTFLNGKMVPLTAELSNNDKITIGKYTLHFLDQTHEAEEVKAEKREEETIVVQRARKSEEKQNAEGAKDADQPGRQFTDKEKMIFFVLLVIVVIAVVVLIATLS